MKKIEKFINKNQITALKFNITLSKIPDKKIFSYLSEAKVVYNGRIYVMTGKLYPEIYQLYLNPCVLEDLTSEITIEEPQRRYKRLPIKALYDFLSSIGAPLHNLPMIYSRYIYFLPHPDLMQFFVEYETRVELDRSLESWRRSKTRMIFEGKLKHNFIQKVEDYFLFGK